MLQISFACGLAIALIALLYIFLKISKFKTYANNGVIFIALAYILGVVMFACFYTATYVDTKPAENIFSSFYSAIKMFALGNGKEVFEANAEGTPIVVYPDGFGGHADLYTKIIVRYVGQISALIIVSGAIISKVGKALSINGKNLWISFKHACNFLHRKSYSRNIIYTDLEYDYLKPFLENLQKDKKSINKVVILKTSATTQHGQELGEIIKLQGISVVNEGLDFRALKKFCFFHRGWKINFYSLMYNDIDNLAFADEALKFYLKRVKNKGCVNFKYMRFKKPLLRKEAYEYALTLQNLKPIVEEAEALAEKADESHMKAAEKKAEQLSNDYKKLKEKFAIAKKATRYCQRRRRKDRYDVDFYVSFQNETFNNKTNFSRLSNGHIKLVSEYDTVATKFVFENPISRLIYEKDADVKKLLSTEDKVNIHFIGFGGINQAIAAKMLPNYQLSEENVQVNYRIATAGASEETVQEFLSKFPAASSPLYAKLQSGMDSEKREEGKFLLQRNISKFFSFKDLDAFNDKQLYEYASEIIEDIMKSKDAKEGSKNAKHFILIALGSSQNNVDVALKLRTHIRNIAKTRSDDLLKKNSFKQVVIYPYVKENNFFKQSPELFSRMTEAILSETSDKSSIDMKKYNEMYEKFATESNFNKAYYENDLSFVFEINYVKDFKAPCCCKLRKLGITKADWFRFYDYFHDASYKYEQVPIVNFGRGGYLADPAYEGIIELAKYVNRHFCGINNKFDMEDSWVKQNYQNQQSNIGTVLSFPMKANVLGFKFQYNDLDSLVDYVHLKDKKCLRNFWRHCAFKKSASIAQACFDQYINTCEYLEYNRTNNEDYEVLKEAVNFTDKFEEYLKENSKDIADNFNIPHTGEILTLDDVKNHFVTTYDKILKPYYENYVKGLYSIERKNPGENPTEEELEKIEKDYEAELKAYKDSHDEITSEMAKALENYYNLIFKSILTPDFYVIRNIEHNRWYLDKTYYGVVPREVNKVKSDYTTNKSKDGLRHLCMTSNGQLEVLGKLCIKEIARDGYYLVEKNDLMPKYKEKHIRLESFKDLPFDASKSNGRDPLLFNIYKTNYYSDVFQYRVLVNYIIDRYQEMKECHLHRSKHNFILRMYDVEKLKENKNVYLKDAKDRFKRAKAKRKSDKRMIKNFSKQYIKAANDFSRGKRIEKLNDDSVRKLI